MKELNKTSRVAGLLEKMHREINKDSFNGTLETPVITLQSKARTYGHISCSRRWTNNKTGESHFEINISTQYLTRPIEDIVATLIHEMTHQYNLQNGVQDCSRGNTYHNKRFKEEAEKHMIEIEHDDKIGWSITKPTEKLLEYIITKGWTEILITDGVEIDWSTIIGKIGKTPTGGNEPKTTSSHSIKYQCPCCGNSVRATKIVNVICGDCMKPMEMK